jgi:hypothetical protein
MSGIHDEHTMSIDGYSPGLQHSLRSEQSGLGMLDFSDDESSPDSLSEAKELYGEILKLFSEEVKQRSFATIQMDSFLGCLLSQAPDAKGVDYLLRNFLSIAFKDVHPELQKGGGNLVKLDWILKVIEPTVKAVKSGNEPVPISLYANVRAFVQDLLNSFYLPREFKSSCILFTSLNLLIVTIVIAAGGTEPIPPSTVITPAAELLDPAGLGSRGETVRAEVRCPRLRLLNVHVLRVADIPYSADCAMAGGVVSRSVLISVVQWCSDVKSWSHRAVLRQVAK